MDLKFSDVEKAGEVLAGKAVCTPLLQNDKLNEICRARVFVKAECLQLTGSFKFRGGYNAISQLPDDKISKGIVAASSGNHAQGVALAARMFGVAATIIMPRDAPSVKISNTQKLGGEIVFYNRSDDREKLLQDHSAKSGAYVVHPFNNAHVIAGQGTVGLEIARSIPALDFLLAPTGGGGLIAGVSLAIKNYFPACSIHTVEPENYDDYKQSLEQGELVSVSPPTKSVCDAIVTPRPGALSFAIGKNNFSHGLVVSDDEAMAAVAFAANELKLIAEPSGCVALAALLFGKINVAKKNVAIVISGGNIDNHILTKALNG